MKPRPKPTQRVKQLEDHISRLILAGFDMSNICFNLKQLKGKILTQEDVSDLENAQNIWDSAVRFVRGSAEESASLHYTVLQSNEA